MDSSTIAAVSVGVAIADAVVVGVGAGVIAIVRGVPLHSMGEFGFILATTAIVGAATSLQMEILRKFAKRAVVLVVTALLTAAAVQLAHSDVGGVVALFGRFGFPVSALASASEEPLRLDLAARALSAGVTYDLALMATLLALPGNRARGPT